MLGIGALVQFALGIIIVPQQIFNAGAIYIIVPSELRTLTPLS